MGSGILPRVTRWFANLLIWLALVTEIEGTTFEGLWSTPLTPITTLLFKTVAHIVPWDVLVFVALALAWSQAPRKRVPAVAQSLKICFGALVVLWTWGVASGGSAYQTYFQLHAFVMGLAVAWLVAITCHTSAHVVSLGKLVAFAAMYRAVVCAAFYLQVARQLPESQQLAALTDHCDSVLFVCGLFILLVNALERRKLSSLLWFLFGGALIVVAIVLNNRRIAWLGVGVGLGLVYLLLPSGRLKRRLSYALLALSPFLIVYVVVGWGNPAPIFKPVRSISTMFGANQDTSSIMRDIENYNLLRTLKTNPLLGYGWGREYIEEIVAFDISSIFPQYRYLPHNSLLGAIAFTGMLGFWGLWQVVLVTVYLHARVFLASKALVPRIAAMSSIVGIVMIEVQMWGDVGFNHQMVCVMLAITIGLASRLPVLAGLWPVPKVTPNAATAAPQAAAAASGS